MDALAKDFESHNYDLRHLMRTIVTSSAYQLSAHFDGEWKDSYAPYFVRRFVRRLPAEMICDAISQATGVFNTISLWGSNERFPYDGKVKYVMQTRSPADLRGEDLQPMREMLIGFGQTNRDNLMVRDMTGNMTQAAILLNSKFAKERIKIQEGGRLHKLLNHNPPLPNGEINRGDVSRVLGSVSPPGGESAWYSGAHRAPPAGTSGFGLEFD